MRVTCDAGIVEVMRRRALFIALALFVAYIAAFAVAGGPGSRLELAGSQPTSTSEPVAVDVGPKVVEQGPLKDPVDIADLAQTGSEGAADLVLIGLALVAVGLVLVDLVGGGTRGIRPRGAPRRS